MTNIYAFGEARFKPERFTHKPIKIPVQSLQNQYLAFGNSCAAFFLILATK
jgi:hypothetical protein